MFFFLRVFGFYGLSRWRWSPLDPSKNVEKIYYNQTLWPEFDTIWLKTSVVVRPGWYLFCIMHSGGNNCCFGSISSQNSSFMQSRPMYPERKRFRVVRVRKKQILNLKLENISSPLQIKALYVRKIYLYAAWSRIYRRCEKLASANLIGSKPTAWRLYNKIQKSQRIKGSLFSYALWQKQVESLMIQRLPKQVHANCRSIRFISIDNRSKVLSPCFVCPCSPGDQFFERIDDVIQLAASQLPHAKLFYGDDDVITEEGIRVNPIFRSAWNRELFWSKPNYANSWFIDSEIWNDAIDRLSLSGKSFNFHRLLLEILYLTEKLFGINAIAHIPLILVHIDARRSLYINSPQYLSQVQLSLKDFFECHSDVFPQYVSILPNSSQSGLVVTWAAPKRALLSVIIPTRDSLSILKNCIDSIYKFNPGVDLEVIIVNNGSAKLETQLYLQEFASEQRSDSTRQIVIDLPGPFNYSYLNNKAALLCRGDVFLLLNNDTAFLHSGWGSLLVSNALRPGIGCVGAKLLYPDHTVQHAGVILGIGGTAGHAFKYYSWDSKRHASGLQLNREYAAVTAACLAISRVNWSMLGGLDEHNLHVNYNDVDLCLRAFTKGLRNLYLSDLVLYHYESKTRGKPVGSAFVQWKREQRYMDAKWSMLLRNDPYYHPCLTLDSEDLCTWLICPDLKARTLSEFG